MKALIVVDMIDQFVFGSWANKRAQAIVGKVAAAAAKVNSEGGIVVAVCDNHKPDDPELRVWGEHAMNNTVAAELIPELREVVDYQVKKRTYDAFFETNLEKLLHEKEVTEVILVGVLTNICVRHTAAGAFFRGYDITIISEAVEVLDLPQEEVITLQKNELEAIKTLYGAKIVENWEEI